MIEEIWNLTMSNNDNVSEKAFLESAKSLARTLLKRSGLPIDEAKIEESAQKLLAEYMATEPDDENPLLFKMDTK